MKKIVIEYLFIKNSGYNNPNEFFKEKFKLKNGGTKTDDEKHKFDFPHFIFSHGRKEYRISYDSKKINEEVYHLKISTFYDKNKEKHVSCLDDLNKQIDFEKKDFFNLVCLRNDVSSYYATKIFKDLNRYETSMRALISVILIPRFKHEWYEEIIHKHPDFKVKGNKKQLIEKYLEELNLGDLEIILFKRFNFHNDELFDNELSEENLAKLNTEDLVCYINKFRPTTLWDMYFDNIKIENLQQRMKKINQLRNKVAHNKTFTKKNFDDLKAELDYTIIKIDTAIMVATSRTNLTDFSKIVESIGMAFQNFSRNIVDMMHPVIAILEGIKIPELPNINYHNED